MSTIRPLALLATLLVSVAGCSHYAPPPAAFHSTLNEPYRLDSGDSVRVLVYDEADLSRSYAVDQAGYVSVPLVGAVPARGRTVQELEIAIAGELANGFLRDPDVAVEVDRYRPVFIMGEVTAAGQYLYVPGMTVQKAVAAAGGFSPRALQSGVDITRSVNGEVITGRVPLSDPLLPGDTLYVRERLF